MDFALLVLRVVVGSIMAGHGAQKLFGSFGGAGLDATGSSFEGLGMRPGRVQALAAGSAELGGGLLIVLGLFTPLAAAAIIAVMIAAIITVHARNGLWVTEQGMEYNLVLIAAAFALAGGPGSLSLDSAMGLELTGTGWAIAALGAGMLGGGAAVLSGRLYEERRRRDRRGPRTPQATPA
jgi:putative oxidoreductase